MSKPKTQRSYTRYLPSGDVCDLGDYYEDSVPVLVVPSESYDQCEHDWFHFGVNAKWCENCGRLRLKMDKQTRGPRILRAAR